jgi:cytochrome c5
MTLSSRARVITVSVVLGGGLLLRSTAPTGGMLVSAQTTTGQAAAAQPKPAPTRQVPVDKYDRQWTLMASQRSGAEGGAKRGQELYYMKCWFCHNEYTIMSDRTGSPAPSLRDVAKRMNAREIGARILTGSFRMPSYGGTLTESDVDDIVTYLLQNCGTFKKGGGCFDEHNPPPNPLFRSGLEERAVAKSK